MSTRFCNQSKRISYRIFNSFHLSATKSFFIRMNLCTSCMTFKTSITKIHIINYLFQNKTSLKNIYHVKNKTPFNFTRKKECFQLHLKQRVIMRNFKKIWYNKAMRQNFSQMNDEKIFDKRKIQSS